MPDVLEALARGIVQYLNGARGSIIAFRAVDVVRRGNGGAVPAHVSVAKYYLRLMATRLECEIFERRKGTIFAFRVDELRKLGSEDNIIKFIRSIEAQAKPGQA